MGRYYGDIFVLYVIFLFWAVCTFSFIIFTFFVKRPYSIREKTNRIFAIKEFMLLSLAFTVLLVCFVNNFIFACFFACFIIFIVFVGSFKIKELSVDVLEKSTQTPVYY